MITRNAIPTILNAAAASVAATISVTIGGRITEPNP